jgi:asparagine synthase (glutamine-hydrolysing)
MSGIVGILNLDRSPVDERLLGRLTRFMSYRGPDAEDVWLDGHVGFGHAMLRTTTESVRESQPCSLDGLVWITADARVDGRNDLIRKLELAGRTGLESPTDPELLLHAYHAWGDACVDHVIGDFAFAIWDGRQQQLFCARDHFGLKPFYYARLAQCLVFGNTLNSIREHPAVSSRLNEVSIGDFLLFDFNQDPLTTAFLDIRCLPPAHTLTWSETGIRLSRYWSLPIEEPLRYKRSADYVDHFRELLQTAVEDRIRTDRVAVYMSGGLDSTLVAAAARSSCEVRAHTVVYDWLIPDEERHYAGLAASALGISTHYLAADNYIPFWRWDEPDQARPEPDNVPLRALEIDQLKQISVHSRVAFYCEGPDNLLRYEWQPYVTSLIKAGRFGRLLADVGSHILAHRRLPLLRGIPNRLRRVKVPRQQGPGYPPWLNPAFASRVGLRDRWEEWLHPPASAHPIRPKACASLELAVWRRSMFEFLEPGVTGFPVEVRFPYMDLRMVRFLLALPAIPWCADKHVEREAMRGVLPEPVRLRPKAPLADNPVSVHLRRSPQLWHSQANVLSSLAEYVCEDRLRLGIHAKQSTVSDNWMNLRPFGLNNWLDNSYPRPERTKEKCDAATYQEAVSGSRTDRVR